MKKIQLLFGMVFMLVLLQVAQAEEITLNTPPQSIGKWYQPHNKHQVWLHTMFKLRRQMQAISEYIAYEDQQALQKWVEAFAKSYLSIGKMVPEWQDELESEWLQKMRQAARKGDYARVGMAQRKIRQSCSGCHNEFKAVTALLYRSQNFDAISVEDSETLEEQDIAKNMNSLSNMMNRMLIALSDRHQQRALDALEIFRQRLEDLSNTCEHCHQSERQKNYLMNEQIMAEVDKLADMIEQKQNQQAMRATGKIAVEICAKCHAIHRTLDNVRTLISKESP